MKKAIHIEIGGKEYLIRPLTVRQVRGIEGILTDKVIMASPINFAASLVEIGLSRDHSDIKLDDLESTPAELGVAVKSILALGGFERGEA